MNEAQAYAGETWLLRRLLPQVSRSFYLSLRILPRAPGRVIGLAYLLARSADTLSDSDLLPSAARLRWLGLLHWQIHHGADPDLQQQLEQELGEAKVSERSLLQALPRQLAMLAALPRSDSKDVRDVLDTLISGMQLDLETFSGVDSTDIRALSTALDTDDYCYRVAGCVGEFWTRLLTRHLDAYAGTEQGHSIDRGVDFGKALQLTNILRDLHEDLCLGRCYLPAEELQQAGISASDLLDPASCRRAEPVLGRWLARALYLYERAREYIEDIPRRHWRLRLAALWPALIGLRTLSLLAQQPDWPSRPERLKLRRRQVYTMMLLSLPAIFSRRLSTAWLAYHERRLRRLLNRLSTVPLQPDAGAGPCRDDR